MKIKTEISAMLFLSLGFTQIVFGATLQSNFIPGLIGFLIYACLTIGTLFLGSGIALLAIAKGVLTIDPSKIKSQKEAS